MLTDRTQLERFLPWAVPILVLVLAGCDMKDTESLLIPRLQRSEVFGLVAGFGTTFAAFPDLLKMLRRPAEAVEMAAAAYRHRLPEVARLPEG